MGKLQKLLAAVVLGTTFGLGGCSNRDSVVQSSESKGYQHSIIEVNRTGNEVEFREFRKREKAFSCTVDLSGRLKYGHFGRGDINKLGYWQWDIDEARQQLYYATDKGKDLEDFNYFVYISPNGGARCLNLISKIEEITGPAIDYRNPVKIKFEID